VSETTGARHRNRFYPNFHTFYFTLPKRSAGYHRGHSPACGRNQKDLETTENTEYAEKQKKQINFFRDFRDFRSLKMPLKYYLEIYFSCCQLVLQRAQRKWREMLLQVES
jgi:hypothetical protein